MRYAWLRCLLLLMLLPLPAYLAQTAISVTTLNSSSSSLQLPGSLTLTATVKPPKATAGMPKGSVNFLNNATHSLGTGMLTAIPSTQNFSAPATDGSFGYAPYGLFALPSGTGNYSVLGVLDYIVPNPTTGIANPQLTVYSGQGAQLFQTSTAYSLANSNITGTFPGIDAVGVGDFNHDGILDVLIHGFSTNQSAIYGNEYYVLPGKAGSVFDPTTSVISADNSGITCNCSNPTQVVTVDDFNGDGYADVAYTATQFGSGGLTGVAVNAGATAPGSFTTFVTLAAITPTVSGETFQSAGIASGHFTSSGRPDIAVVGTPSTGTTGYVALYVNQGSGSNGAISFAAPVLFDVGTQPSSIATADFRANGMTDVVVTNLVASSQSGSVQVLFGDGNGHLTSSSTVGVGAELASVSVADFNNDGYPDILVASYSGALYLLLNDGTGHFSAAVPIAAASQNSLTAIGDFNGDGLADITELTDSGVGETTTSAATEFLNSASSQATLVTAAQTLPAGADTLTAEFPGDNNFTTSTSAGVPVAVTQTQSSLTWAQPAAVEYGTPLGVTQLDATPSVAGTIIYSPAAGTVLPPGPTPVTATFVPTDTFDYVGATASETITVNAPTLAGISPSTGKLGDPATTIAINGQGLVQGALVEWNATALSTTWVSLNQLTAVIPASLLATTGTGTITVIDPNTIAVAGSQTFTVTASPATASASAQATVEAGQDDSLTLTVSPYPAPIIATLTLEFTPSPPNTITDPAVLFPNNTTTDVIQIPANSTTAIPAIDFATGSTAGTITLTITLTASGVDITPASLTPVTVAIPAAPPVINSVTLDRTGNTITVAILGLSSTRDMTQAVFHFTAASGASLKTTDLTVDLAGAFSTWYQAASSNSFGTTYLYTQPFTLSSNATDVGSVTVTLTNSQGTSQPGTAQ
jgi:FG-GAP-like repeat/FG-GAP repeat